MTEVERRRLTLLRETRKTYSLQNSPPAIHPRYQSVYQSLYGEEQEEGAKEHSTIVIRTVIAMLLFVLFYVMDYRQEEIGTVNSQYIVSEVQKDLLSQ